ncbi:helix-turn-helix domain-containing protein [Gardnerella sp. Marseille-QA0894]
MCVRPVKLSPTQVKAIKKMYESRTLTVKQIAEQFHISVKTVYNTLKR